jgi:hypothetical protein
MTETIQDRIQAGNKAYYANLMMLKNRYINRGGMMQIYKTLIRQVGTYGCESLTMKKEDENILRRFGRKFIRRIYGPVRQGREWTIRNNEDIDNIIRRKKRFVKERRVHWKKKQENLKAKINELETNSKNKSIRELYRGTLRTAR